MQSNCSSDDGRTAFCGNEIIQEQNGILGSRFKDHRMMSKYEELALVVKEEVEKRKQNGQGETHDQKHTDIATSTIWWCGIAGGPGSGKSTLAKRVSEICNTRLGIPSIVVPMDGYMFSRKYLSDTMKLDHRESIDYLRRRGSPHTINVEKLCKDISFASGRKPKIEKDFVFGENFENKNECENKPSKPLAFCFPGYCRTAPSDPIPDQIQFDPSYHRVVFVEGEYLLLGKGGMVPGYVTETESKRWKPLLGMFDSTWFVSCQKEQDETVATSEMYGWYNFDFEEQKRRRRLYHLEEDEDDEDTLKIMFPSYSNKGGDEPAPLLRDDVATKRIESNDVLNMLIAETCKEHASLVICST